ncbi:MAG: UvrD-helicase domain-containing protein, partial [Allosphingosinicella sp.]
ALAAAAFECCARLLGMKRIAAFVACLACGLRVGRQYAAAYEAAKRAAGAVDFDDLIRSAERLLETPGMGEWVRYKLDQATDHILVDEAQDTNAAQWRIVATLTEEFFAGAGAVARHRTLFTVGDYKQAIFGFQGTDPSAFERARAYFEAKANAVRAAGEAADLPPRQLPPEFLDLSMDRSFRSSPPVLRAVDGLIRHLGHEAFGLPRAPNPHLAEHGSRAGGVTLWRPFTGEADASDGEEAGEEGWISDTVRAYAARLARQVRSWINNPFVLEGRKRPVRPEDILILVRRRGDLAALIVARLHTEGVPVAGVDRLLLTAPLAVRDLLAAIRFAVSRSTTSTSPPCWSRLCSAGARTISTPPPPGATASPSGRACATAATRPPRACSLCSPWPITRRRINSSRPSSAARSAAAAGCSPGLARRRAIRSRNCSPPRSSSRQARRRRCSFSSTGSPAATSRSSATRRRRSTRCG